MDTAQIVILAIVGLAIAITFESLRRIFRSRRHQAAAHQRLTDALNYACRTYGDRPARPYPAGGQLPRRPNTSAKR